MSKKTEKNKWILNEKFDYPLLIITLFLLSMGLIMLLSASTPKSLAENHNSYTYVIKQGAMALLGLVLMMIISKINYKKYKKFAFPAYIASIVLLFLVGFVGEESHGARRWIKIAGFTFQPSEFAKVVFIVFFAKILSDLKELDVIKNAVTGFFFPLLFLIPIIIAILIKQNHFSATFIICIITVIQMFVAGSCFKCFVFFGSLTLSAVIGVIFCAKTGVELKGFRFGRIDTWLNIESDLTGDGWQINQSLFAIGSGGLFGLGLGNSKQKYLYLPEPQNDFIFSVLAEELGFIGCITVFILFVLFIWRGIVIALRSEDTFGTLISVGVTALIGIEAMINIAVVTNTVPVTGMPLPFFSYGGSAMISNLAAVGLLLSVSRNSKKNKMKEVNKK